MKSMTAEEYKVGNTVEYGVYGGRPIKWRVLAKQGKMRLLCSQEIVTERPYNPEYVNTYWETSPLRKWLNKTFFMEAFSIEERSRIVNTRVENLPSPRYFTSGGADTVDKLFIFNIEEAEKYFSDGHDRALGHWWWLRTPGSTLLSAASVYIDGTIYENGVNVYFADGGVRPAMWVLTRG